MKTAEKQFNIGDKIVGIVSGKIATIIGVTIYANGDKKLHYEIIDEQPGSMAGYQGSVSPDDVKVI